MMRWIVYCAPEGTAQADTIIVGPFRDYGRAQVCADRIDRKYADTYRTTSIVLPLTDQRDALHLFPDEP